MNNLRIHAMLAIIFIFATYVSFALQTDFVEIQKDSSSSNILTESLVEVDITAKNKKEKLKELELLAENFTNKGLYNKAIDVYNDILEQNLPKKKLFEYYVKIGDLYNLNKNYVYSISSYQKALQIHKKNPQVIIKIGNIFSEQKLFILAEKEFTRALKIDKHSVEATIGQGNVLYKQGNYVEALKYYNKISNKFSNREIVKNIADCYISLNRNNEAVAILESFLEEHNDSELIFDLGRIYINRSDYNRAEDLFLKFLKTNNSNFKIYVYLGAVYDLNGK
ncbi:MAG: tetratricopeptide repeat protein, partial [Endomicrobium sp.]|nr:tetratricopeptide repeat protein [Endomicrobium sp.]